MKFFACISLFVSIAAFIGGCSNSNTPNDGGNNPPPREQRTEIIVKCHDLKPARAGESYALWFQYTGDPSWYFVSSIAIKYIDIKGDMTNLFYVDSLQRYDKLSGSILSLERTIGSSPTLTLLRGSFISADTMNATITPEGLGDFSNLTSNIVFTSSSADPTAYTKEFYLTSYDGAKYSASLSALPIPANGWTYGLWAVDSSYEPDQLIFYGTFNAASGHDSYPVGDNLAFPGGDGRHPMNSPSGSIIVTLEPDWYGNDVGKLGPSAYSLLRLDREKSIVRDSDYDMINVSATAIPTGTVQVIKP